MRPLQLRVENLTSFRGKQPAIDFRACELFAIAGPTGSGKSSLLDAIVFALYGNIPRVGKSCSEMISLGGDRLSVVLDFALGGGVYRVTRVLRRGKGADAQLEDLSGPEPRPLADGVRAVDAEIARRVGLGFDAFVQCVILPQGEFARFLKSEPGRRRETLGKLLQLTVYERMRARAAQDAAVLSAQLDAKRDEASQLGDATPEALDALEREIAALRDASAGRALALVEDERALTALRDRHRMSRELLAARAALAALAEREAEAARDEARVADARRAAIALPALGAADRTAEAARETRRLADAARAAREEALRHERSTAESLRVATGAAAEIPVLDERLRALSAAMALLPPIAAAQRRVTDAAAEERALDERHALAQRDADRACAARDELVAEAARRRTAVDLVAYDDERHRRLARLAPLAAEVGAARGRAGAAAERARDADDRSRDLAARHAAATARESAAVQRLAQAEADRREASEALERAVRDDMASHLRGSLHPGQACPVCEQTVARPPEIASQTSLDAPREALRAAEAVVADARDEASRARGAAAALEAQASEASRAAETARTELRSARADLASRVAALVAGAARDLELADAAETALAAALEDLERTREAHARAAAASADAAAGASAAAAEAVSRGQHAAALAEALARQTAELERARRDAGVLEAQLAACGTTEPEREREAVTRRRHGLDQALDEARRAEAGAREAAASAEAKADESLRSAQADAQRAREARAAADAALAAAAFASAADARRAALPQPDLERLAAGNEEYRRERHAQATRADELETALGGALVDDATLEAAAARVDAARARREEDAARQARLEQKAVALGERAARAAELRSHLLDAERRHAIQRQLAADLGGPRFQEFLLRQILRELTDGASVRLLSLTGRYGFDLDDGAFVVVDHDSAGERRSADTLSGGETFLASLALALELGEQVRRASGALDLDSLFIDEGFGTLDPETLDTVATAIEGLQANGRMVGVITHIPELTSRFPVQLHVSKGAAGARVEMRHA